MDSNTNNILYYDNSISYNETYNNMLSNINFDICLFTFIFVVYFLYTLLKDFFNKR